MNKRKLAAVSAWLIEQWPDAIMLTDRAGLIEYVNRAFEALTGYRRSEVLGRSPALLKSGRQDARFYRRLWSTIRKGKPFRGVFLNRRKSGALFHEEEIIRPLRGPHGHIAYFLSAGRDVSAQMRSHRRLAHAATHDALTGLPNRRVFVDRLEQALHQAARRKERLAVAIMDLDGFKSANTRFGHLAGDAVLRAVAARTRRCLRAADTVARIGGDEFALLLSAVERRGAAVVLGKVCKANSTAVRYDGRRIAGSVSLGAALYPDHGRNGVALIKRADRAMYAAKNAGGNRCGFAR